jgi:hypothetical protein
MNPVSAGPAAWEKLATGLEIDKLSVAPLSTLVKSPTFLPEGEAVCSRWRCLPVPLKRSLPQCFIDHEAAPSIVKLFSEWVRRADQTANGVIMINRQTQDFSDTTVDRAIRWLVAHKLMLLTEKGSGRGNGSRYFVRWTFAHPNPATRQRWVNSRKPAKRVNPHSLEGEAQAKSQKQCFSYEKTCARVSDHKGGKSTDPNYGKRMGPPPLARAFPASESSDPGGRQRRKTREDTRKLHERSVRWAMARLHETTSDQELVTAGAYRLRQVLSSGSVFIGPEFRRLVQRLTWGIQDLDNCDTPRRKHAAIGHFVKDGLIAIRVDRLRGAERHERERQRAESKANPIGTFSCRQFNADRDKGGTR